MFTLFCGRALKKDEKANASIDINKTPNTK